MDARLNMVLIERGETAMVSGEKLISGDPQAGCAWVTNFDHISMGDWVDEDESKSTYGFAVSAMDVISNSGRHFARAGCWFAIPGPIKIRSGAGVLIRLDGWRCLPQVGGPIEQIGRLRYIDGCTDTVLVAPPRLGDPVLNHLHFPPGIRQTLHTHPSLRCGVVARGTGRAIIPDPDGEPGTLKELPLRHGDVWFLPVDGVHGFYTDDDTLDVIAWHPDSDTGPTDQDHPMLNRTLVEGVSARELERIQTPQSVPTA